MNHTQEPWWKECGTDIVTKDGKFIATTHQPESMVGTELEYENARRIVACVNACTNIETEVLEQHALGVISADYSRLLHAVRQLKAMKGRFHTEQAYKALMQVVDSIKG